MPLTVHHLRYSQSERIVWLCEELGLDYTLKLHLRDPVMAPKELQQMHPLGTAPVIEDTRDGGPPLVLGESGAIAEYIMQTHGGGRLALPPGHKDYVDYIYYFHFANGNLQAAATRALFFRVLHLPADNPWQATITQKLDTDYGILEDRLGKAKWLAGDEFTAADVMNAFSVSTMRAFLPHDLTQYPNILRWLKDIGERPAYKQAMKKGEPGFEPALSAKGPEIFPALKDLV